MAHTKLQINKPNNKGNKAKEGSGMSKEGRKAIIIIIQRVWKGEVMMAERGERRDETYVSQ